MISQAWKYIDVERANSSVFSCKQRTKLSLNSNRYFYFVWFADICIIQNNFFPILINHCFFLTFNKKSLQKPFNRFAKILDKSLTKEGNFFANNVLFQNHSIWAFVQHNTVWMWQKFTVRIVFSHTRSQGKDYSFSSSSCGEKHIFQEPNQSINLS